MLPDHVLQRLVRAAENLAEREVESGAPKKSGPRKLDKAIVGSIISYLLEPYEHGYWEINAEWNTCSPIAKYLVKSLNTTADFEKDVGNLSAPAIAAIRKLGDEKKPELLRITSRISAINVLFKAAVLDALGLPKQKHTELDAWVEKIDLADLRAKFADAYAIFLGRIYTDKFVTGMAPSKPHLLKEGVVTVLSAPKDTGHVQLIATNMAELSAYSDFYRALGVIKTDNLQRVFAPDEALFKPYFALVSSVLDHVVHDSHVSRGFTQALAYYEEEDFQHCISSLGLLAEAYIQRIYTTLLREPYSGSMI